MGKRRKFAKERLRTHPSSRKLQKPSNAISFGLVVDHNPLLIKALCCFTNVINFERVSTNFVKGCIFYKLRFRIVERKSVCTRVCARAFSLLAYNGCENVYKIACRRRGNAARGRKQIPFAAK